MTTTIENFILEDDNFLTPQECQYYIKYFDFLDEKGFTAKRKDNAHVKEDGQISLHVSTFDLNANYNFKNNFINKFWETAYPVYAKKYSIFSTFGRHAIHALLMQRTEIGQGYHVWHCETDSRQHNNRLLTFVCYLNDVDEGGETEFLYYPKRVKPKQGKLVLFPGAFTHTYRGNPPISNTKDILTGWVYYGD